MDEVGAILRTYQTLAVGVAGFTGIIIVLLLNSWKDRRFAKWRDANASRSIRAGLRTELSIFLEFFHDNLLDPQRHPGVKYMTIPKNIMTTVFFMGTYPRLIFCRSMFFAR
jgi:hypothetical protein